MTARGTLPTTSVIGVGPMGAAIARTLHSHGSRVTVWNRTRATADALATDGIKAVDTPAEAIVASDVTILCVFDHAVSQGLLDEALRSVPSLDGRVIVETSSSTPKEAREQHQLLVDHGAEAIDGSILCFPEHIGTPKGTVVYAGDPATWERVNSVLDALGDARYVGEDPGAARIVSKTASSVYLCAHVAFVEAYAGALALGADSEVALDACLLLTRLASDGMERTARQIQAEDFDDNEISVASRITAAEDVRATLQSAGSPADMADAALGLLQRVVDAGRGDQNLAALADVLRDGPATTK